MCAPKKNYRDKEGFTNINGKMCERLSSPSFLLLFVSKINVPLEMALQNQPSIEPFVKLATFPKI